MTITTAEEAKTSVKQWLEENHHKLNEMTDDKVNFHFEVDYPVGSLKRQRVLQPKDFPGLVVLLNGVSVAKEHVEKLKELSQEERESFYAEIRNDLIFNRNSYDINIDEEGVAQQIQFSFEFYLDSLTKTKLFEGLLLNHRTLIYIVSKFNDRFGLPVMPDTTPTTGETVGTA